MAKVTKASHRKKRTAVRATVHKRRVKTTKASARGSRAALQAVPTGRRGGR